MKTLTLSVSKLGEASRKDFDAIKKRARAKQKISTLKRLENLFPHCFSRTQPKPLKLGIERDIAEALPEFDPNHSDDPISNKKLQRALKYYVSNIAYKTAIINSPFRFDLSGNPSGPVEPEHKDDARRWLAALPKPQKSRNRAPQHNAGGPASRKQPYPQTGPHTHQKQSIHQRVAVGKV